jgi:hypothetical protein
MPARKDASHRSYTCIKSESSSKDACGNQSEDSEPMADVAIVLGGTAQLTDDGPAPDYDMEK